MYSIRLLLLVLLSLTAQSKFLKFINVTAVTESVNEYSISIIFIKLHNLMNE